MKTDKKYRAVSASERGRKQNYKEKYQLDPEITNKYAASVANPTVQPDGKTETGVPIPDRLNTEFSKEYEEENEL